MAPTRERVGALTVDQIDAVEANVCKLEVPEWGGIVKIRALGLLEARRVQVRARSKTPEGHPDPFGEVDNSEMFVFTIMYGMVEPAVTEGDVRRWADTGGSMPALMRIFKAIDKLTDGLELEVAAAAAAFHGSNGDGPASASNGDGQPTG